ARLAHGDETRFLGARNGDDHTTGRLGEQRDERVAAFGEQDATADLAGDRSFDDGLDETAFGHIVRGAQEAVTRCGDENLREQLLVLEVDLWRQPTEVVVLDLGPDRAAELVARLTEKVERLPLFAADSGRRTTGDVVDDAE